MAPVWTKKLLRTLRNDDQLRDLGLDGNGWSIEEEKLDIISKGPAFGNCRPGRCAEHQPHTRRAAETRIYDLIAEALPADYGALGGYPDVTWVDVERDGKPYCCPRIRFLEIDATSADVVDELAAAATKPVPKKKPTKAKKGVAKTRSTSSAKQRPVVKAAATKPRRKGTK